MRQQQLFDPVPRHKFESLSKEELIEFIELQQKVNETFKKEVDRLRAYNNELEQKKLYIDSPGQARGSYRYSFMRN